MPSKSPVLPSLPFDPHRFEQSVAEAVAVTRRVLGEARQPQLPSEVHHAFDDKYSLAEAQLSAGAVSALQALQEGAGLTPESLRALARFAAEGKSVTLRFAASTSVAFLREEKRDVEQPTKVTTETSVAGMLSKAVTTRVVTTVTEFFWAFEGAWQIDAYRGAGREPSEPRRRRGWTLRRPSRATLRATATR